MIMKWETDSRFYDNTIIYLFIIFFFCVGISVPPIFPHQRTWCIFDLQRISALMGATTHTIGEFCDCHETSFIMLKPPFLNKDGLQIFYETFEVSIWIWCAKNKLCPHLRKFIDIWPFHPSEAINLLFARKAMDGNMANVCLCMCVQCVW